MYRVQLTRQAEKALSILMKSQPKMGIRVGQAIDRLAANPQTGIPLRGELKGCYKYRVGSYRIIYRVEHSILMVVIIDIGDRKEIYR